MRFSGKTAIVVGGSQGIGACISERLAREGAGVAIVASSDARKAQALADRINGAGGRAAGHAADVRDAADLARVVDHVVEAEGKLDLLVNCAGVFYGTPIGGTAQSDAARMIDINLLGAFNCVSVAAPHMKKQGSGKIVTIASVAAVMGIAGYSLYCATKAGVSMMTRALALELAPAGININAIAPGNTATPINENIRNDPEFRPMLDAMAARTPSGNIYSSPDDIASLALYLLSEDARAMHGSTVLIDEGFSAGM